MSKKPRAYNTKIFENKCAERKPPSSSPKLPKPSRTAPPQILITLDIPENSTMDPRDTTAIDDSLSSLDHEFLTDIFGDPTNESAADPGTEMSENIELINLN